MNKNLISWNTEDGFQGEIVAYFNLWTGQIITKEEYEKMVEREIFDMWHVMDDEEKKEFDNFEHFRRNMLSNPDDDFMPLVEYVK